MKIKPGAGYGIPPAKHAQLAYLDVGSRWRGGSESVSASPALTGNRGLGWSGELSSRRHAAAPRQPPH